MELNINNNLKNKWNFWYHSLNDNNWSLDSYYLICTIEKVEDLIYISKKINNMNNGLFFLMKYGISPIYEDCQNIDGGYWSFRINKKSSYDMWMELIYYMCIEEFNNEEFYNNVNGISISPKVNNSIIKIWNKCFTINDKDDIKKYVISVSNEEIFYLKHEIKS
jgi:hypothetical protein